MFDRSLFKHYQDAVSSYLSKQGSLSTVQSCKKLNSIERKLIQVRYYNRKSDYKSSIELLLKVSVNNIFFMAERHFLMAQTYSFLGRFESALKCNLEALELYQEIKDRRGIFLTCYNISVDYSRLGLFDLAKFYLNRADDQKELTSEIALISRAQACHFAEKKDYASAIKIIEESLESSNGYNKLDLLNSYLVASDIYVEAGEFNKALDTLNMLNNTKSLALKDRYLFERALLSAIVTNSKLLTPASDMNSGVYKLKWEFLKLVESGQLEAAKLVWNNLRTLDMSLSKEFLEIEKEVSEDLLFTKYLKIIKERTNINIFKPELIKGKKGKELYRILAASKVPIRKEELVELVWETPYRTELDSRFYKLIQRVKEQSSINIVNSSNAYTISM